jgi:DNA-binding NtrC family response regulator
MIPMQQATVLVAVTDVAQRQRIAQVLAEAGFEVWQAQEYNEAISLLHGSPRRLVTLIGSDLLSVLEFAVSDRRLVHHHCYIVLVESGTVAETALPQQFPYLSLWTLAAPTPEALTQLVDNAARALGTRPGDAYVLVKQ